MLLHALGFFWLAYFVLCVQLALHARFHPAGEPRPFVEWLAAYLAFLPLAAYLTFIAQGKAGRL